MSGVDRFPSTHGTWILTRLDRSWVARVPESLRSRLGEWLDAAEREYGDSPH